ncbi:hypothetical protein [Tropicibacter naphthalenivorans]|uniref:hypothetical protein n=1 Tax=Tropicibacter naphthalenivorans TaxID=441103 RepID=UPI001180A923|nr:hypothetical protein [Tropicibacter naphthalenivorans]
MAENGMSTTVLSGLIAAFIAVTGAGISYIVDFEKRISINETRLNALTGIAAADSTGLGVKQEQLDSDVSSRKSTTESNLFSSAISEGCLKLITTYNSIVSDGALYSSERERLEALKSQMSALGCTTLGENP